MMTAERPFKRALDRLNGAGLRPTRQRLGLARLLFDGCDRHITAEQLHGEALAADLPVSLATVYNTLNQFTSAGLLREVVVEAGKSYFDTNTSDHHHFFLEAAGRLEDIPADRVLVQSLPAPPPGTRIARVDVIVRLVEADGPETGGAETGGAA
ncbi:iron response transcriptional regulator IrrA [Azospirillum picis]|uniref:Ferric uptake regulation protein n=1 Tax=Azospirillum picis TaxID=488438 RepID=A0ABU0MSH1_9PROT|nr:Fur family transcriptional regulator [Azospirillum picis]MBP2301990.1 Fur family iron response transcriptional regulator [Azospirillum picis]MDQ0536439.1 Fur family iron response transcriptional regulator [Azospirillum picis]